MLHTAEVYCMNTCTAHTDTHMSLLHIATGILTGTWKKYNSMLCRDEEIERAVQINIVS